MESNQPTVFKYSLKFGLIIGAALIGVSLLMYILDLPPKHPLGYLSLVVLVAGIVWSAVDYRNKISGGYITYGKAFTIGFVVAVIAGLLSAIYTYFFMTVFDPAAFEKILEMSMEQAEERMASQGLSDEQMEAGRSMTRVFTSPVAISVMSFITNAILGGVVMLLAAIFIKKEDNSFEAQTKSDI